jgi:hypothetical protein
MTKIAKHPTLTSPKRSRREKRKLYHLAELTSLRENVPASVEGPIPLSVGGMESIYVYF